MSGSNPHLREAGNDDQKPSSNKYEAPQLTPSEYIEVLSLEFDESRHCPTNKVLRKQFHDSRLRTSDLEDFCYDGRVDRNILLEYKALVKDSLVDSVFGKSLLVDLVFNAETNKTGPSLLSSDRMDSRSFLEDVPFNGDLGFQTKKTLM